MRPVITSAQHIKNVAQQAPGGVTSRAPVPFDDSTVAAIGHRRQLRTISCGDLGIRRQDPARVAAVDVADERGVNVIAK